MKNFKGKMKKIKKSILDKRSPNSKRANFQERYT